MRSARGARAAGDTTSLCSEEDPKTSQGSLRHADAHTTLQIFAHSRNEDRMTAQGDMLTAFFAPTTTLQLESQTGRMCWMQRYASTGLIVVPPGNCASRAMDWIPTKNKRRETPETPFLKVRVHADAQENFPRSTPAAL